MDETIEQDAEPKFLKKFRPFLILISVGFLLYLPTIAFKFTFFDDNNLILDNQYFLANWGNIFYSFLIDVFHSVNGSAFYYRPILTISFILDYHFSGIYPFMYHFTNVILHMLASCLIYVFFIKLNYKKIVSFLLAIIFLIHPVSTQAVAWIPGRNDSLLAIFLLLNFIYFIKYLKTEKIQHMIFSVIFFGLGLFTKESGICAIPILFYYLLFIYKGEKSLFKKYYFFFGAGFILVIWGFLRSYVLVNSPSVSILGMFNSIYLNFPATIQFIGKIFIPVNLSVLPIIEDTTFIYGIIAIVFLFIIILLTKKKRLNFIFFGCIWFLIFLLPAFVRPNGALIADFIEHRLYVPIIGIFIILLETDFIKRIDFKKY